MNTSSTLADIGTALFGPFWHSPLAALLNVSPRTLRRWLAGESSIPIGVWPELAKACQARSVRLCEAAKRCHKRG